MMHYYIILFPHVANVFQISSTPTMQLQEISQGIWANEKRKNSLNFIINLNLSTTATLGQKKLAIEKRWPL